tara:strand:- start:1988 stop:3622 length:1635 start_codon:yes stop_codon:yes gene_type:complete
MIKSLKIQNYFLLKNVDIELINGFTVVSGETGSGKSIMLDALLTLLGKRVDRFSQKDTPKSIIEGVFIIDDSKKKFFSHYDLDFEKETVVRREINDKGKSRSFINDTPVLLSVLTAFGKEMVEIHTQHQSVLLKDPSFQFKLIDEFAQSEKELRNYQNAFDNYKRLKLELNVFKESEKTSLNELEFLRYQLNELEEANLIINEKSNIEEQISILDNSDGIISTIFEAKTILENENGVVEMISKIRKGMLEFNSFQSLNERIESILIELNDINSELLSIKNNIDTNPELLLELNNRLNLLNSLLQKHNKKFIEELIELKDQLKTKINNSLSYEEELLKKQNELDTQLDVLKESAELLNLKRGKSIPFLKQEVEDCLKKLGISYAEFEILLNNKDSFQELGNTEISFLFSANKGKALHHLSKVVSGGELSRLMLSLKYIVSKSRNINTLIFDEIDSGVSGKIASLMGEMMLEISKKNQIISISHLPQIASKADMHLKLVKTIVQDNTISDIISLNETERIEEIATLLSGNKLTAAAFKNARELLKQ